MFLTAEPSLELLKQLLSCFDFLTKFLFLSSFLSLFSKINNLLRVCVSVYVCLGIGVSPYTCVELSGQLSRVSCDHLTVGLRITDVCLYKALYLGSGWSSGQQACTASVLNHLS